MLVHAVSLKAIDNAITQSSNMPTSRGSLSQRSQQVAAARSSLYPSAKNSTRACWQPLSQSTPLFYLTADIYYKTKLLLGLEVGEHALWSRKNSYRPEVKWFSTGKSADNSLLIAMVTGGHTVPIYARGIHCHPMLFRAMFL